MNLYPTLKYIHVIAAIAALGISISYGLWFARVRRKPEALLFTLRTIKLIDDWIATPAYIVLLPSGWWLASLAGWSLATPWILTSLVLYGVVSVIGLGAFTPTLRKQIVLAEGPGPGSADYKAISNRPTAIGVLLNVLTLIIIYLMVAKPELWS